MSADLSLILAPWLVVCGGVTAAAGWLSAGRRGWDSWTGRAAAVGGWSTLTVAAAAWLSRALAAGHLPLFGTWESALSLALATALATALVAGRLANGAPVWGLGGAVTCALVAHGLRYDAAIYPLTISERSWVVDVHALVAWAAFAAFAVATGLAVRHLAARPAEADHDPAPVLALRVAFLLHTAMLASGSVYKFLLFGTTWTFDPVESLGFVAWVAYGTLLHVHLLAGWSSARLARWSLGLFVLLVVSYRGIVYFPAWSTYHIFDMDLRLHLVD